MTIRRERAAGKEARSPLILTGYPGGKRHSYKWILEHLPEARRYVEGFAGAATVLLNRARSEEEFLVERNPDQATLLKVIRDQPEQLVERLRPLRWNHLTFLDHKWLLEEHAYDNDLERAVWTYTVRRQSFGSKGESFNYLLDHHQQRYWDRGVENLAAISERLRGVEVLEGSALDWLAVLDSPEAVYYLDPPYVWSSRTRSLLYGDYEMSDADHRSLCLLIRGLKGKVALSGYPNPIYGEFLGGWRRVSRAVHINIHRKPGPRERKIETLWLNF